MGFTNRIASSTLFSFTPLSFYGASRSVKELRRFAARARSERRPWTILLDLAGTLPCVAPQRSEASPF